MTAEYLLVLHTMSIISVTAATTFLLLNKKKSTIAQAFFVVFGALILITGIGLMDKYNESFYSLWLIGKLVLWVILMVLVMGISQRYKHKHSQVFFWVMIVMFFSVLLTAYRL